MAGERQKSTGATGARLKEGAGINKSLFCLGNVINALTSPGRGHVPYRDSQLTRLLQDSLGGNSVTLMVANVSPSASECSETTSALRFAERMKKVKNTPVKGRDPAHEKLVELMEQNRALQEEVDKMTGKYKKKRAALKELRVKMQKTLVPEYATLTRLQTRQSCGCCLCVTPLAQEEEPKKPDPYHNMIDGEMLAKMRRKYSKDNIEAVEAGTEASPKAAGPRAATGSGD